MPLVVDAQEDAGNPPALPYFSHVVAWWRHKQQRRARALLQYKPLEAEFTWRSSETHTVKRSGFPLTHASFLSSTASQGQTLRTGVTIDCARIEPRGRQGADDDQWWLHLYVMFSRATCLEDMLLMLAFFMNSAVLWPLPTNLARNSLCNFAQEKKHLTTFRS